MKIWLEPHELMCSLPWCGSHEAGSWWSPPAHGTTMLDVSSLSSGDRGANGATWAMILAGSGEEAGQRRLGKVDPVAEMLRRRAGVGARRGHLCVERRRERERLEGGREGDGQGRRRGRGTGLAGLSDDGAHRRRGKEEEARPARGCPRSTGTSSGAAYGPRWGDQGLGGPRLGFTGHGG